VCAPTKAAAATSSAEGGAYEARVVAIRSAALRRDHSAGTALTASKSRRALTASTQRSAEDHPVAAVAPTTAKGESRVRIALNDIAQTPKKAMHIAIVPLEYSRLVSTSLGTTVINASQLVQMYRRTRTSLSSGGESGVGGPST
jgi:hypothetical protein